MAVVSVAMAGIRLSAAILQKEPTIKIRGLPGKKNKGKTPISRKTIKKGADKPDCHEQQ
ncbi:MAG: hypothetical protein ACMZ63_09830 [Methylotenera sp.]